MGRGDRRALEQKASRYAQVGIKSAKRRVGRRPGVVMHVRGRGTCSWLGQKGLRPTRPESPTVDTSAVGPAPIPSIQPSPCRALSPRGPRNRWTAAVACSRDRYLCPGKASWPPSKNFPRGRRSSALKLPRPPQPPRDEAPDNLTRRFRDRASCRPRQWFLAARRSRVWPDSLVPVSAQSLPPLGPAPTAGACVHADRRCFATGSAGIAELAVFHPVRWSTNLDDLSRR